MLRFAPSPTGDMHVGDLRVALFNYIASKQRDEEFIIRMEDTDKERNIEGKDKEILDILGLFGVTYSSVIYQSENLRYHRMMAIQLLQDKQAFNCFCTPDELDVKRAAAKKANKPFRYDDTCAHLTPDETIDNLNAFTIRLRRPKNAVVIDDFIQGEISFAPEDIDAFIIMDDKKLPTHDFACAVDDMISDISLVVRAQEHMHTTPKQITVRDALGYDKTMQYAHLPMILNADGKHDDTTTVKWLLEEGFLPSAITNYLINLGNKTPTEIYSLEEALEWFELKNISNSPARFDIDALKRINAQHLRNLDAKELSRYVGFADESIGKIASLYLEEVQTLKELRPKIEALFAAKVIPEEFTEQAEVLRKIIMAAPYFETFDDFKTYIMKESGLKGKDFSTPLRLLLTGNSNGPEVADLYVYLKDYLGEIVK